MTPLDEAQIYDLLRTALIELFEIEPERISMDANLYEDLEIDSIDAIDLIDHVKRKTGYRLVAEDFRSVRTIGDVVAALLRKQQQGTDATYFASCHLVTYARLPLAVVLRRRRAGAGRCHGRRLAAPGAYRR